MIGGVVLGALGGLAVGFVIGIILGAAKGDPDSLPLPQPEPPRIVPIPAKRAAWDYHPN